MATKRVAPYLSSWFPEHAKVLDLPEKLWSLMEIGVGGYIVGRTVVRVNGGPVGSSKGPQVSLSPVVGRRTRAVVVAVNF